MRILIADDNEMVRRRLAGILSATPNCEVCGQAVDGEEAIQKAGELLPDLILLDICMPGISGLEAARVLQQTVPAAKILIMTQHDPIPYLPSALAAGAHACMEKSRLGTDLLSSIRSVTESAAAPRIATAG
jgi:DNA-binding NarL/FixJ family response regulator